MSLINEALKRAEYEKRRQSPPAPGQELTPWPAAGETPAPAVFARRRTGLGGAVAMGLCVIATVAAVMYFSLPPARAPLPVSAGHPASTAAPVVANLAVGNALPAQADPAPGQTDLAAQAALSRTLETLHSYRLDPPEPGPAGPANALPGTPTSRPVYQNSRHADESSTRQPQPAPAPVTPAPEPPAAPRTQRAPATSVAVETAGPPGENPRRFEASQFQVGGIMESANGAHAIINNHLVSVGDEIEGARVVAIRKYQIVLEKDGKRLVLKL